MVCSSPFVDLSGDELAEMRTSPQKVREDGRASRVYHDSGKHSGADQCDASLPQESRNHPVSLASKQRPLAAFRSGTRRRRAV